MPSSKKKVSTTQPLILRQSNKISRSPTVPGLRQAKVYRYFLMRARPELLEKEYHKVYQEELREFLGSNDWDDLKESIELIRKVDVRWDLLPQKGGGDELLWGSSPLLADCEIRREKGGKIYFRYSFSPRMREELTNPKFFRDFDLRIIREFQSSYSMKFYEFCLSAINPGQDHQVTEFVPKESFWALLGLGPDEYKNYYSFKQRVVKPAIKEVNEMTDLRIDLIRKKIAPKKYSFAFKIERQNIQSRLGLGDPKHELAFKMFMRASPPTKDALERDFFIEHPELKFGYKRGERNEYFEGWLTQFLEAEDSKDDIIDVCGESATNPEIS